MGISGRIARAFLQSKLTPLVTVAALVLGAIGMIATPREEEPQISVPMIDVIVGMPGAAPAETENLLVRPLEKRMYEIPGVDHVYSVAGDGYGMVTVRFDVGEDQEESITKVHGKLFSVMDDAPRGATQPLVKPHSIDDVPIVTLTLHSAAYDSDALRQIALHLEDEVRALEDVAQTFIVGGEPKQITVTLDPARLAARGVTPGEVSMALDGANARLQAGDFAAANQVYRVDIGAPLATPGEVGAVVVTSRGGGPVYVRDVADIRSGYGERESYVFHAESGGDPENAVTLAVAKRAGANATVLSDEILERVAQARDRIIPAAVDVEVTRNYGETAGEKAGELIFHLLVATLSVTLLIGIFLGWREALVVLVAVPVTLALTLFVYYAFGYTLNRITLFALIFSIGILVDDAIVVVENIYRHLKMGDRAPDVAAVEGVDEVGNPTILATFTVIAAILPMAVVSGMMGPYMRPIPVGASVAMLASLAVAFVVTPWLAFKLLRGHVGQHTERPDRAHEPEEEGRFSHLYGRIMNPLIERKRLRWATYAGVLLLLAASISLVFVRAVQVKMLPFDNKSEFQVILDLPEGSTLETSQAVAHDIAGYLRSVPEVETTQVYAGTASPFNFNGLVRHYFMRSGPNVADIQVNLAPKHHRDRQSHDIAVAVRPGVDSIARLYDARAKVAEIPPGPPVLSTLVAEVYGPDEATRLASATRVMEIFETTEGVVDVDWTVEAGEAKHTFRVDRARAAAAGASVEQITRTVYLALSGSSAGVASSANAREGVQIVPRLALADRSSLESLLAIPVATATGPQPLGRFASIRDRAAGGESAPPRPEVRGLCHRGCGGHGRVPGVRDPRHERPTGGGRDRRLQRPAAGPAGRGGDQVGWRVAGDHRGLPGSRPRVRRGPPPDLRAGGGLVPVLHDPTGHHGADPAHAGRDPARTRPERRLLHRDLHDRDDRPRRDHCPQLDPPRGLHSAGAGARTHVARGGARSGRRAVPAHRPDRRGRHGGRHGHGPRPHLRGPRCRDDQRRAGGHSPHHGGGPAPVLGAPQPTEP